MKAHTHIIYNCTDWIIIDWIIIDGIIVDGIIIALFFATDWNEVYVFQALGLASIPTPCLTLTLTLTLT
jgi:hypothetical protein